MIRTCSRPSSHFVLHPRRTSRADPRSPSRNAQVVGGTISGTVTDAVRRRRLRASTSSSTTTKPATSATSPPALTAATPHPPSPSAATPFTAKHDGFAPQQRTGIPLTVGQSRRVNLTLTVGAVNAAGHRRQTRPSVVNLSTQQTSGLVDERQIKQLPLNGRSYDQLITLNPATVNYTGQRSGSIGTSNSSVGNMFAVSGRRPQDNLFLLNGIEYTGASLINVTPGGTSGQLLGVDAVREFNVVTDTYSRQLRQAPGRADLNRNRLRHK